MRLPAFFFFVPGGEALVNIVPTIQSLANSQLIYSSFEILVVKRNNFATLDVEMAFREERAIE